MHIFIEVALLATSVIAGLVLFAKSRSLTQEGVRVRSRSALALVAWVPVWICTYLLWHPFTSWFSNMGDYNNDGNHWWTNPWAKPPYLFVLWFWILLAFGVIVKIISTRTVGNRKTTNVVRLIGAVLLVTAIIAADWSDLTHHKNDTPVASPSSASSSTSSSSSSSAAVEPPPKTKPAATATCPQTWEIKYADHDNNRLFSDGVEEIRKAKTPVQAKEAARVWVNMVSYDPINLSAAAAYFLDKSVDPRKLASGKCASTEAKLLGTQLEIEVASAKAFAAESAPATNTNSGVHQGQVTANPTPGISGNRKSVKVVRKNGTSVWILGRCGNPTKPGKPPVKPGPTDEKPPKPKPTPSSSPTPEKPKPSETPETTPPPTKETTPPTPTPTPKPSKSPQSDDCMLNGGPTCPPNGGNQPPQSNGTINTGPLPGAPTQPINPPQGPPPQQGSPAPPPNSIGYDAGSSSAPPGGTTCDSSGCSGGGPAPPTTSPTPVDSGTYSGDPGGF